MIAQMEESAEFLNYTCMKNLRHLRIQARKTQKEIAQVLGISQSMYAKYERCERILPLAHLAALSQYYHVSTDYLLGFPYKPLEITH